MGRGFFYLILAIFIFLIFKTLSGALRPAKLPPQDYNGKLFQDLQAHVHRLSQKIGERSLFKYKRLEESAEYITNRFKAYGYSVEFQEYLSSGKEVRNIIASKIGTGKPQEIIIVGAHYDTCFNPGADDNASGVAGLLELARFISERELSRTIKFIAFVNEEPPFFKTEDMGSRQYARLAKTRDEDIKAVLILEMIGYYSSKPHSQYYPPFLGFFYPHRGNFICIVGNFKSHWLTKKIVSIFKRESQFPIESFTGPGFFAGIDFSDHWSFWKEGYPAVMITDTAFYRNPHYHSSSDTYDKLDYKSMAQVIEGLGKVLIELAR